MRVYYYTVSSDCDGRHSRDIGYFLRKEDAEALANLGWGSGAMGPEKGRVKEREVYESMDDFVRNLTEERSIKSLLHLVSDPQKLLRERALAKLTPEERKALGV